MYYKTTAIAVFIWKNYFVFFRDPKFCSESSRISLPLKSWNTLSLDGSSLSSYPTKPRSLFPLSMKHNISLAVALLNWENRHTRWQITGPNSSSTFDSLQEFKTYPVTGPQVHRLRSSCLSSNYIAKANRSAPSYWINILRSRKEGQ